MRSRLVWLAEDETGGIHTFLSGRSDCRFYKLFSLSRRRPCAGEEEGRTILFYINNGLVCDFHLRQISVADEGVGLQAGADREPEVMEVSLLLLLPDRNIAVRNKGQKYDKYTAGKDSVEYCQLFLYLLKHGYPFIAI